MFLHAYLINLYNPSRIFLYQLCLLSSFLLVLVEHKRKLVDDLLFSYKQKKRCCVPPIQVGTNEISYLQPPASQGNIQCSLLVQIS